MNRTYNLVKSSLIVIVLLGADKLLSVGRLFLVADDFGTSPAYDAFTAANQLPELFYTLIAGGALAAALIPVYSQYLSESKQQATRLAHTVLTLVLILLGLISLVSAIFAPWITRVVLVPNFSPEQQQLTAVIMRVILIQTTIFGLSGVLSSLLNAHQHFALPALAPIALDVGYLIGLFLFVPQMGIVGLAWGTVVGSVLHLLIQVPALIKYGLGFRFALQWQLPGVQEIVRLMGPRLVSLGAIQAADLAIIRLTSDLPSGSTSAYFYGYAFMQFPQTLLGTAIALVVFPTMAELFNLGDIAGLKRTAVNALRIIWFLVIPAAALMLLLGRPALALVFDQTAVQAIFLVLIFFSVRIFSESTNEIVARLFYARHNTRTPMFVYVGWLVISISTAYAFHALWGIAGLALSSTVAFTALAAVLYWLNARELGGLGGAELRTTAVRSLLATAGMSLLLWGVMSLWSIDGVASYLADHGRLLLLLAQAAYLALMAGLGTAVYLGLNQLLGGQELRALWQLIRQRP